jgi:predicted esterase
MVLFRRWYDVENMNRDRLADSIEDDEESMMNSVAVVDSLIEKEVTEQGINEDRIVIGGFSQGCVVTTLSSLILKRKLAGLIALSGWLALSHKIEEVRSPALLNPARCLAYLP